MADIWTIQSALEWTQGYLERKGDANPRLSAQWLLSEATGLSRIDLYVNFERPLDPDERQALHGFVERRGNGEPLQYITGEVGFRHIVLKVRPGVLIPRPETEVLVSVALAQLPPTKLQVPVQVADLCTGSGAIACSIAYEYPTAQVVATDIAPECAALARENAAALGLDGRITVLECDLGAAVPVGLMGSFDLVVSNPPYVPSGLLPGLPDEVAGFEPHLALDGGPDGLGVFRLILPWALRALAPGGAAAFELHEDALDDAAQAAEAAGFTQTKVVADLAGRSRVLVAKAPGGSGASIALSESPLPSDDAV
ncbi:MAG: peptide chain release factor N(5)-glutamine methyltransferase [Eggerthellaceae bacterium]|nr:peptide chain release factor N(5)-glutamine methyltransferase [Eggerthellaceae bacterium]